MENKQFPIEALKRWQDEILEKAKENLLADGYLRPVAFLMAEKMGLSEDMQKEALTVSEDGKTKTNLASQDDVKPSDIIVLVIDLAFSPRDALTLLKSELEPKAAVLIQQLEKEGAKFGIKDPEVGVLNGLMQYLQISHKDVALMALRKAIKKTDAFAIIQLDEAFIHEAEGEEEVAKANAHKGPVEMMERHDEAIMCIMETEGLTRMLTEKFARDVPKTGKITGFIGLREVVHTPDSPSGMELSGPFTHVFKDAKEQSKSADKSAN